MSPRLSDAELVTLAVLQALLGFTSESRWLRYARAHLGRMFPYLPQQPGYNKRLRAAGGLVRHCIRAHSTGVESTTQTSSVHRLVLAASARMQCLTRPPAARSRLL